MPFDGLDHATCKRQILLFLLPMLSKPVYCLMRGVENKPWLGQGLRFGLALALFCTVPIYLIYYCVQPVPEMLVIRQIAYDLILMLVVGAVVAFLYRGQGRA